MFPQVGFLLLGFTVWGPEISLYLWTLIIMTKVKAIKIDGNINTFQRSCSNHTYQVLPLSPLCLLSEFFYNHNRPYLNMVSTML